MKKLSIILLISLIAAATVFAGSLPKEVVTVRAVGDYRKMQTTSGVTSTNTLMGAGFAVDYDEFFNSYIGLFGDFGVTVPLKSDVDGRSQEFEYRDFPVYAHCGVVGRVPVSNKAGIDLRLGLGVTYDKASTNSYGYVVETSDAYYYIYTSYSLAKVEYQLVGGASFYTNIDSEGSFGIKIGAMGAVTFYTSVIKDAGYRWSTEIADLKRVGFEIQPYVGFTFGFNDYN